MPKISDLNPGGKLMIALKSEPGAGKTLVSGSFPGKKYFFDTDGRMKPLSTCEWTKNEDIDYDTYHRGDFEKFNSKIQSLLDKCPYDVVVISSLTSLADVLINYSISETESSKREKRGVIEIPQIKDYNVEDRALSKIVDFGRKLPCHFILECHVIETTNYNLTKQETIVSRTMLTAGKKIAAKIPAYFDEVYYIGTQKSLDPSKPLDRFLYTEFNGIDSAKTSLPIPAKFNITGKPFYPMLKDELAKKGIVLK